MSTSDTKQTTNKKAPKMNTDRAFQLGRAAFRRGDDRLSCPIPAPYSPPRTPADAEPEVAAGLTTGAYWLDGFEQERDDAIPRVRLGISMVMPLPMARPR
jgi:hypothetical protein